MQSVNLRDHADAWPAISFHLGVIFQTLQSCWQVRSTRLSCLFAWFVSSSDVISTSNLLGLRAIVISDCKSSYCTQNSQNNMFHCDLRIDYNLNNVQIKDVINHQFLINYQSNRNNFQLIHPILQQNQLFMNKVKSYQNLKLVIPHDKSFEEDEKHTMHSPLSKLLSTLTSKYTGKYPKSTRNLTKHHNFFPNSKLKMVSPKMNKFNSSKVLTPYNQTVNTIQKNQKIRKDQESQKATNLSHIKNLVKIQSNSTNQQPKRPKILNRVKHVASLCSNQNSSASSTPVKQSDKLISASLDFNQLFRMGKLLGKGRFGDVCMATHIPTNSIFAAKMIGLQKISSKLLQRIIAEIKIQFFIKHENCLSLYNFFKEDNKIILVLELGECSLFDVLREKRFFDQKETAYYIRQVINALRHLHSHGIIHRDLKPENIVLVNNVVKLADFGWSIYTGKTNKRKTFCGTLDYVSPQIVLGAQYDQMVDVWSVGVLCYELCTGHAPFQSEKSRQETYRKILSVDLKFPRHLSLGVKNFISSLLVRSPENRMTLDEALEHPWLKYYENPKNYK